MKWTGIFIGVTLIISITVISCFMIYTARYECENIVWALFFLLTGYLILTGYLMTVKAHKQTMKKCISQQQQEDKNTFALFESEIMKKILILEAKIKETETEM